MKNTFQKMLSIGLIALFISSNVNSQIQSNSTCYNRDGFTSSLLKSNSLSVSQIAETERYDVNFYSIDIAMNNLVTDISGTGEIHGTANEALDSVLFELFETLIITDIRVNGTSTPFSRLSSSVKVPVNITTGQPFIISIDYSGTPPNSASNPLGGSGMTNATVPTWGNQITWSLSDPFYAYEWWPCKQSLTDKADSCSVKITVPSSCKAGSNGLLENVIDLGNGTTRYEWNHKYPIEYYLISVTVGEYVEYNVTANPTGSSGPVLIQNYIYDDPQVLTTYQNDLDETVDFIELFADLFGPYPFQNEKYGHCMAPIPGGMEHQTMSTLGFFDKELTSHELSHQWWGNSTTYASWSDIWVSEGFASYSEYLMKENLYPTEAASHMNGVHASVKGGPHGSVWCLDSLNPARIFSGRLTYDKGAAIIHTFRFLMNDDNAFFQALHNIQNDFYGSTAYGLDIRDYFSAASGIDLTDAFNEWYFGEGYPNYSTKWNNMGNDVIVEISHTTSSSTPTFTNDLELKFARSGMSDTTVRIAISSNLETVIIPNIINATELTHVDPNNWIINNAWSILFDSSLGAAGVSELSANDEYSIAPNPSNGNFSITSSNNMINSVEIRDLKGRLIDSSTFKNMGTIDISKEENGYYILHITNENGNKKVETIIKK